MKSISRNTPLFLIVFLTLALNGCQSESANAGKQTQSNQNTEATPVANSNSNSEITESADAFCEQTYKEVLQKYEQDFASCLSDASVETRACKKPEGFDDGAGAKENLNVVIALDASGSMNGKIAGASKMEIAKKAVNSFINTLPEQARIALVVYGHRGSNEESRKQESCAGVEPVYQLARLDKTEFARVVNSFNPTGYTPLASAINKSGEVLNDQPAAIAANLIYVVSDGIETCGGNPAEEAARLHQSNTKAVVNIIGFDVDNAAQQQLKAAATAGGGQYFDARNEDELNRVFGGVAKSVAEYNEYLRCMTANKQDVKRIYGNKINEISLCVNNKIRAESRAVFQEHLSWSRSKDPRAKCTSFVIETQNAREERIKSWAAEIVRKIKEEKDLKYEDLEGELKTVTEKQTTAR